VAEVYAIGFPNGKLYIGITTRTTEQRFRGHVKDMQRGSTYTVHKALRKYGPDSVRLVTLHSGVTDDEAKELEKFYIAEWDLQNTDNGYNMTAGGDGCAGLVWTVASRQKLAAAKRGTKHSRETRRKMSETRHLPEVREKMSAAKRGGTLGDEHRKKIAASLRGRPKSEEHREKVAAILRSPEQRQLRSQLWSGRKHTAESRRKMSESLKGRPKSEETRCKLARAQKGKTLSPEIRAKISESLLQHHEEKRKCT